jgi:Peptidase_C39 like family
MPPLATVLTDLFIAIADVSPHAVASAIPPACRRSVDSARVTIDGDTALLEAPMWTPRRGARHLVPSCSLLGATPGSFRFELSVLAAGRWTPWVATTTIGPAVFPEALPSDKALAVDIDMYTAPEPVERVRLRVRMHPSRVLFRSWVLALSASNLAPAPIGGTEPGRASSLCVPARSQMDESPAIRDRICSPTCVAMALEYWRRSAPVAEVAAEVFHPRLDRYGIWPAAIQAAARRGLAGYLLRFPDWASAAWCLAQGLPVIASIRYERDELEGAAVPRTDGHLVVLTGQEGADVLVNDPAGRSPGEVRRRYRRDEFCRVWLERGGVGYVFFGV